MILLVLIGVIMLLIAFPALRCGLSHPILVPFYAVVDTYEYFRYKKYNDCPYGLINVFTGLFGDGKTLSVVHLVVCFLYMKYDGKQVYDKKRKKFVTQRINIISNVTLSVPYTKFVSMEQVATVAEDREKYDEEHDTRTVTIVLGDEFSSQMNSREFRSNFNMEVLNSMLTCRHNYLSFYLTSQEFTMIDLTLRRVTRWVVDCKKFWRFQMNYYYSPWDVEQATNVQLIKPIRTECWFIKNEDYNRYDTMECVGNLIKQWRAGDMMTDEEKLALEMPGTGTVGPDGLINISRKFKRAKKKQTK